MNRLIKYLNGNKFPKIKLDLNFINLKLGYGNTSTLGTLKALLNLAAQQAQANTDARNYLAALRKGERWAVTKNLLNRGLITLINLKVNGHIPTLNEINQENQLRQNPIKGASLRWNESWENNTNPVKAILKSGVLYANPYTGALNAGYNLANSETGVGATYNAFKNGNYLQGAVSGAFNLIDAGMMGNGVVKGSRTFFNKGNNIRDNIVGKNNFDFYRRFSSTEMPKRLQIDPSQTFSLYKKPISLDHVVNESLPSKFKTERFTNEDLKYKYDDFKKLTMDKLMWGFNDLKSSKRWQSLNDMKLSAENVGIKNPSLIGLVNVDANNGKYKGVLISGDNVKDRGIDLNSPQMNLMREQYAQMLPEEFLDIARLRFDEEIGYFPTVKRYFTYTDSDRGLGGYFDPETRTAVINLRNMPDASTARSTFIHEVNSHGTDDFFKNTNILTQYENVLKDLNSKLPWYELRSTLNELKNKLSPSGNLEQLKEKLSTISDNMFMNKLSNTNGYGESLVNGFDKFDDNSFVRPDLVKRLKWATGALPAVTPIIMNNGNSE